MRKANILRETELSLNDLCLLVRRIDDEMGGFEELLGRQPMEGYLRNLQATADGIGSVFPKRPVGHPRYRAQWNEFASGRRKDLDRGTIRYLCWEPDIATSDQFLIYITALDTELSRRPLAGLVRSCHHKWNGPFAAGPSTERVRRLVNRYVGPSPVILKWKSNIEAILGVQGPEMLGRALVEENKTLVSFAEEWYLDFRSPFVHKVAEAAAAACRLLLAKPTRGLLELLFGQVLLWPGWEPHLFRQEIAELILHGAVAGQTREILQKFILANKHLGDPRLESNRAKWAGMPIEAIDRMRLWLTENPFRLLEKVYQEGRGWTVRPQDRRSETPRNLLGPVQEAKRIA
jgi:hypothetical protein